MSESTKKVTAERVGIWAGIVVPVVLGSLWVGGLDTRVNAADAAAAQASTQAQVVTTKIAALEERTKAIQESLADIKKTQDQQAADAAAAQREIIAALRGRRGN